ncbi:MAG: hypothetical protein ACHQ1G_06230 [Planctomycetota bacterium]
MRRLGVAIGLLGIAAGASDWLECVGRKPPRGATTWIRSCEATTYEGLLGRVIVLVYWSPAAERARDDVFLMQEMHERICRRGGRVLALTEAAADPVKALLADESLFCAVGADSKIDSGSGSEVPYAFLIDPLGMVRWQGPLRQLPAKELEAALRQCKPFALPELHDMHEKTAKVYGKGKLVEAACEAMFTAEFSKDYFRGDDRRIQLITEDAKYIKGCVEAYRTYWWGLVEEGKSRGDFDQVLYALEEIRLHLGGDPYNAADYGIRIGDDKRAVKERDDLKKNPLADRSVRATKAYDALVGKLESARLTPEAKAQMLKRFEDFQREWEGTWAARRAVRRAKWLEAQPVDAAKGPPGN